MRRYSGNGGLLSLSEVRDPPLTSTASLVKARARMRDIWGSEGAPRVVDPLMTKHGDPGVTEVNSPATASLIPVQQI